MRSPTPNPADSIHLAQFSKSIRACVWRDSTGCLLGRAATPHRCRLHPRPWRGASSSLAAGFVLSGDGYILRASATSRRHRPYPRGAGDIPVASVTSPSSHDPSAEGFSSAPPHSTKSRQISPSIRAAWWWDRPALFLVAVGILVVGYIIVRRLLLHAASWFPALPATSHATSYIPAPLGASPAAGFFPVAGYFGASLSTSSASGYMPAPLVASPPASATS